LKLVRKGKPVNNFAKEVAKPFCLKVASERRVKPMCTRYILDFERTLEKILGK